MEKFDFQYCQKIVILSADKTKVLLCKRQGEADYDGDFSFPGGKMEIADASIILGMQREKDEELGVNFKIKLLTSYSVNVYFTKNDGSAMILPHYLAIHQSGEVELSEEYSKYQWVDLEELNDFEPKIGNIPETIEILLPLLSVSNVIYEVI